MRTDVVAFQDYASSKLRRRELFAARVGGGGIDRERIVVDAAGENDAVDIVRLFDRLVAFKDVVQDARGIAGQRIAVAAAAAVAAADMLILADLHVDQVRQLGDMSVVVDQMRRAGRAIVAAINAARRRELAVARNDHLHRVLQRRVGDLLRWRTTMPAGARGSGPGPERRPA